MGFQYSPKKIVGGVNLNNVETLNCEEGNFAIFSGNLVHGSASNNGDKIRFSIDFRIINKEYAYTSDDLNFIPFLFNLLTFFTYLFPFI